MQRTSRLFRTPVTRTSRAIATIALGLALVIPTAVAQEESPPPDGVTGVAAPVPALEQPTVAPRVPGTHSPVASDGWNGARTAVLFVEGAADDAPLRLADKPRPQRDWFVQRLYSNAPRALNPTVSARPDVGQISRYILGRLLVVDPDAPPNASPSLALSWKVENEGRRCTYTLRRGVQFADGRPFTSADVLFSFQAVRDSAVAAENLRSELAHVESMTAPDDRTVVVTFRDKSWRSPYVVGRALPILNSGWYVEQLPRLAAELGLGETSTTPGKAGFAEAFNRMPGVCPGTGPYYLESEQDLTGTSVHLTPNPFSWEMQVHPQRHNFAALHWVTLPTEGDAFDAFVHGQLDVWVVSHAAWEHQLSRDPRVDAAGNHYVYDHIGLDCSAVVWNCRKAPFDNADVRRAMTLLTDREAILNGVDQGHGVIATCKSKRSYPTYSLDLKPLPHDEARAEVHLIRAGWLQDSNDDGILDKKGKPFSFELTYPAGQRDFAAIAEEIERSCRHVRIEVRLHPVGPEEFQRAVQLRRFEAIIGFSQWPDPWIDLYDSYHRSQDTTGGGNVCGWHNERADALLEAMRTELDAEARTKLHHEFNKIYDDEQPETLLTHGKVGVLLAKRFEGVSVRPTGLQTFDLWVRPENAVHGETLSE